MRGLVVVGIALQGAGAIVGLVPMVAIVQLVTVLLRGDQASSAWGWLWIALAGIAGRMALIGAGLMLTHLADTRLNRDIRVRLAEHLGRIPVGEAAQRSSGRVKKLVTDDVHALHTLVAHGGGDMVVGVITATAAFALLLFYSWPMGLAALFPLLGFLVVFGSMMGKAATQFTAWDDAKERVNAATVEFTRGIAVVKTFGQSGRASKQYRQAVDEYAGFFGKLMVPMVGASSTGLAIVSAPSVLATMALSGVLFLGLGWIDVTGFIAGLVFGVGLAGPLTMVDSYSVRLRTAREAAARIGDFLATPAMPGPGTFDTPGDDSAASFSEVSFRYDPSGRDVLTQVSLPLAAGSVTALVGPSGSGKSTLAALVPRFWDVRSGAVRIGGADVREMETSTLFRRVGFVFQGTRLVPMSVRDNIRLARPDASDEDVVLAARAANIHDRVVALPRGYDSVVGADALFSGGEAQRLTVARALLEDAPILILDEPTSFADPENEVRIQAGIARAASGRTVLVIAHRLASIATADQIAVLDAGSITALGTHEELLARAGTYRDLWEAQRLQTGAKT
ncbi:ABC transporter ATP-binding protein [Leucobacter sp. M11]|uniref:ABC transporter ATP-binding protein n=1 Tax=Leucobacter sp. M11 TaxID=2993565 RepID=UPI002D7F5561|nr:ABC transporter ATP-binding protein [Leucobacter sp. M11]MEB4613387.1 ABC transporter ATP-binding protein [Leucobacter sp. M11]